MNNENDSGKSDNSFVSMVANIVDIDLETKARNLDGPDEAIGRLRSGSGGSARLK